MMPREESDLLTITGRGTPGGELLRRYWQPAALAEELKPGGDPLAIKLLGEDLVLFRDDKGRVGLLDAHCSHRGADLSYGRCEEGGLRCIYHGWLYDVEGNVLEQPGEPNKGESRHTIRQPSYPCLEAGGIIFAYLGPGQAPLLPNYEFLRVTDAQRFVQKIYHECNYLQSNEGNIDPVHLSFLHRNLEQTESDNKRQVPGSQTSPNSLFGTDIAPRIDVELTDFGLRIFSIRNIEDDQIYVRTSNFIMPNFTAFPGQTAPAGYSVNWHVPIDDIKHWKFVIVFDREKPLQKELVQRGRNDLTPDYRLKRNKSNRYQQDRESMKNKSFSGIGHNFQAQDACVIESAGAVQDRTKEHLVTSDKAIIAARKLMLKSIQDIRAGREALHVVRDPAANDFSHIAVISEVTPKTADFKVIVNQKIQSQRQPAAQSTSGGLE